MYVIFSKLLSPFSPILLALVIGLGVFGKFTYDDKLVYKERLDTAQHTITQLNSEIDKVIERSKVVDEVVQDNTATKTTKVIDTCKKVTVIRDLVNKTNEVGNVSENDILLKTLPKEVVDTLSVNPVDR